MLSLWIPYNLASFLDLEYVTKAKMTQQEMTIRHLGVGGVPHSGAALTGQLSSHWAA